MNKRLGLFISGILLLISPLINAQEFSSLQIEEIYSRLLKKIAIPDKEGTFTILNSPLLFHIEYSKERVKHLGLSLFTEEEKKVIGRPICDFHERLMLSVLLEDNDREANEYVSQNGIKLIISGNGTLFRRSELEKALHAIQKEKPRFVAARNNFDWTTSWTGETSKLTVTFPANIQLIMGMDKKEMGMFFAQELSEYTTGKLSQEPIVFDIENAVRLRKDMFMIPGESLYIKQINSNIYVAKDHLEQYTPVFDAKYPEESVANLFVSPGNWSENLQINIRHEIYDSTYNYQKPLSQLLSFLQDDFETFVGIEHCSAKRLAFTVIFRSINYTYHHLLFVETTPEVIFTGKVPLNSTLYTYIPNHNIKDLYHNQWIEEKK